MRKNAIKQNLVVYLLSVGITILGSIIAYYYLKQPNLIGIDDANITLTYAKHIAQNQGYVYSLGSERVEGSTSLLWTLIAAGVFALEPTRPELWITLVCGVLCSISLFFYFQIFLQLAENLGLRKKWPTVFLALFLINLVTFYAWNVLSLMDTGLWSCLISMTSYVFMRQILHHWTAAKFISFSCALSFLMVLTRPEAMLIVPALYALSGLGEWRVVSFRKIVASYVPGLVAWAITTAGLTLWRLSYFGYPVPNTYYAKNLNLFVDKIVSGGEYFIEFFFEAPGQLIFIISTAVLLFVSVRTSFRSFLGHEVESIRRERATAFICSVIITVLGIVFFIGKDHFTAFRFYQPIYPLLVCPMVVLLANWIAKSQSPRSHGERVAFAVVLMLILIGWMKYDRTNHKDHMLVNFGLAQRGRNTGEVLNLIRRIDPDLSIGVLAAGGIAYTFKGRVYDLLGLNWTKMAHAQGPRNGIPGHSAFNSGVFWSAKPDLVNPRLIASIEVTHGERPFVKFIFKGMLKTARFQERYVPTVIRFNGQTLFSYTSQDWIQQQKHQIDIRPLRWKNTHELF